MHPTLKIATLVASVALAQGCFNKEDPEGMNAGECADGADNDGDGDYDCDDEDCAGAPDCEEEEEPNGGDDEDDDTGA